MGVPSPATVAILAFPETTASVLYRMYDLFASAGRDWGFVVNGAPGPELMRPVVVAATDDAFEAANGVTLKPHAAFDRTGPADIVCVPELAVPPGDDLGDRFTRELAWIRARYEAGATVASACSGAVLLAEAGLLDGQDATTHWAYCEVLQQKYPKVRVHPGARWCSRGRDSSAWSWRAEAPPGRIWRSTSSAASPAWTPRCRWRAST